MVLCGNNNMADRIRIDYSTHTAAGCLLEEARPPAYLKIINKNDDDDCYHCHCIYIINRKKTINVFVLTTFDSLRNSRHFDPRTKPDPVWIDLFICFYVETRWERN